MSSTEKDSSSGPRRHLFREKLGISAAICLLLMAGGGFVNHITEKKRLVAADEVGMVEPDSQRSRDPEGGFVDVFSKDYRDSLAALFGPEREARARIDVARYLAHKKVQEWSKEELLREWSLLLNSSGQDGDTSLQEAFLAGIAERRPGLFLEAIGEMGQETGAVDPSIAKAMWLARSSLFDDARNIDLVVGNPKLKSLYLRGAEENARTVSEYADLTLVLKPTKHSADFGAMSSIAAKIIAAPKSLKERREVVESLLALPFLDDYPQLKYPISIASLRSDPFTAKSSLDQRLKSDSTRGGTIDSNLLNAFISGSLEIDPQRGLSTIGKLENSNTRSRVLKEYADKWLEEDPLAASAGLRNLTRIEDAKVVAGRMVHYLERFGSESELESWRNYLSTLDARN